MTPSPLHFHIRYSGYPMKPKQIISQALLKDLFHYCDGHFIRLTKSNGRVNIGDVAGSPTSDGYIGIKIHGKLYKAHRLAWIYVYGGIPEGAQIDHKNGQRADNKIENLRVATGNIEQSQNRVAHSNNKIGLIGVSWKQSQAMWVAQIQYKGKKYHLGYYDTPEEASEAYIKAKSKLHTFNPIQRN
jgi:hypothetical protein